jgi:hypothetical protein
MMKNGNGNEVLVDHFEETQHGSTSRRISLGGSLSPMVSFDEHDAEITAFIEENNLEEYTDTFRKAAVLLHYDVTPGDVLDITTRELESLQSETERKWIQPWALYFTVTMCSIGAIEQGMAQTSMNGANLYFPAQFGVGSDSPHDTLIVGLINSGIYLSVGCL